MINQHYYKITNGQQEIIAGKRVVQTFEFELLC